MRFQQLDYSCGPASIVNGALALGVTVRESTARKCSEITKEGTDEQQMIKAIRELGFNATVYSSTDRNHAWRWLRGTLLQGSVIILSVDTARHWATCIGMLGETVVLYDSGWSQRNERENGVHMLPKTKLMRRWKDPNLPCHTYYAICMSRY